MFYFQNLPYILIIIETKLLSWHYNNLLICHFRVNKIQELIDQYIISQAFATI